MKNNLFKCIVLIVLSCATATAQTSEKKINLTIVGGIQEYTGELGNQFFNFGNTTLKNNFMFGANASYYLSPSFDIMAMANWGKMGIYQNDTLFLKNDIATLGIGLKYKFGIPDTFWLKPYVFVGTGSIYYDENTVEGYEWMPVAAGLGLTFQVIKNITITYQITYAYGGKDSHDHVSEKPNNDGYLINNLGLGFNFCRGCP